MVINVISATAAQAYNFLSINATVVIQCVVVNSLKLGWNSPDTTNLVPILTLVATKAQLPSSILGPKITT